jgi:hypothetical protein
MTTFDTYWAGRVLDGTVYSCVSFDTWEAREYWLLACVEYGSRVALAADEPAVVAFIADNAAFSARLLAASEYTADDVAEYEDARIDWDAYFAAKKVTS